MNECISYSEAGQPLGREHANSARIYPSASTLQPMAHPTAELPAAGIIRSRLGHRGRLIAPDAYQNPHLQGTFL
jgi:hypothetical protein